MPLESVLFTSPLPRYLLTGALLSLCNLGLLAVLVDGLQLPLLWACTVSFVLLNAIGYALNKGFTFRLGRRWVATEVLRYYGVMAISLAANLALMALLVDGLALHYLLASAVVTAVLVLVNYAGHARVSFRRPCARMGGDFAAAGGLRLLQVSAFFPAHGGGIEVVAGELAARLAAAGVAVHWFAGGPDCELPPPMPGVQVEHAASWDLLERRIGLPAPVWSVASLSSLWRAVDACDVVHVHDYLYVPTLAAVAMARLRGRPVVLTQHIGEIVFSSAFARRLLGLLNRTLGAVVLHAVHQVVFVGKPVQTYFAAIARLRRPPLLVPNGVDHVRFHPGAPPPVATATRLLFVGRFVEKKGLALLRACAGLPGLQWTFVGAGPLDPAAWPAGPLPRDLPGRLPPPAVAARYRAADLLVLLSTGEGFPLVVQEALSCGTPVLVSTEVFEAFPASDPRCVFHVELRCAQPAQALRCRLAALASDPLLLSEAREPAVALAAQWDWDDCTGRYLEIYRRLIGAC